MNDKLSNGNSNLSLSSIAKFWLSFSVAFLILTSLVGTGFWIGLLLFIVVSLLFIDLREKFNFRYFILPSDYDRFYDRKISPIKNIGRAFYIYSFSIIIIFIIFYKLSNSEFYLTWKKESDLIEFLKTKNEPAIIDTLWALNNAEFENKDQKTQLISMVISFILDNNLVTAKKNLEEFVISNIRNNQTSNEQIYKQILSAYVEKKHTFRSVKEIFKVLQPSKLKSIVGLMNPTLLKEEFVSYLRQELEHLKNSNVEGLINSDTISGQYEYQTADLLIANKVNFDQHFNNLFMAMRDYEGARNKYSSEYVYEPHEPQYNPPAYNGVFFLRGEYIDSFEEAPFGNYRFAQTLLLLRSDGEYYVVKGAKEPRNPSTKFLTCYVSKTGTRTINRGRHGTPATEVELHDLETYQEDQEIYAETLRKYEDEYAQSVKFYHEDLIKFQASISKNNALKKERDEKAKAMLIAIQKIF